MHKIASIYNFITFRFPYYAIRKTFSLVCGKRGDLWSKSPLKHIVSPVKLPDGNQIFWSWDEDAFWFRDMIKEIYEDQAYEHFFQAKEGEVVVDVGANIGLFTLKASKEVGEKGKVIAFEPGKRSYNMLTRNIRLNNCLNATAINVALSDFNGKAAYYLADSSLQNTLTPQDTLATYVRKTEVDVRTLSSILEDLRIENVDFLKIDAEGAEMEILRGVEQFLVDHRIKKIAVAAYHNKKECAVVTNFLKAFCYETRIQKSIGLANFERTHVYGSA